MASEPKVKRIIAFVDGQNLYYNVRQAFGYSFPNYDVKALATSISNAEADWDLQQVRFYTGIPDKTKDPWWNHFWVSKLAMMGRQGVYQFNRPLQYRTNSVDLPDGTTHTYLTKQEKGIDVRLALDVIRLALDNKYDVALVFSQDQDLSEVADELKAISIIQNRWLQMASAFPVGQGTTNKRGIQSTKWIRIDQAMYDSCIDANDYRPRNR